MAGEVFSSPVLAPALCSRLRIAGRGLPGGNSLFFCVAKRKVSKRKGDPAVCDPFAALRGNLRCSVQAGSRSNSLRCAALRQSRSLIRLNLRSSAHTEGVGEEYQTPEEPRTRHGVSLSVLVCGISEFGTRIRTSPSWLGRGAQRQADQGSRLSEPKASSSETPLASSTAGCPERSAGIQTAGRLSFGDFSLAKQRKVTCRRATPGQQHSKKSTPAGARIGTFLDGGRSCFK